MNILNIKFNLILAVGLSITGILSGLYWYHGAFSDVEFRESMYGPQDFVYLNRIGNYENLGSDWAKVQNEVYKQFNNVLFIGIYYDNPEQLKDPNQARASLGFSVDNNEKDKIKVFLDNNPSYKLVQLPEVKSYSTSFPYKSQFSLIVVKEKVYPKVNELVSEKKLSPYCLVETYYLQQKNKQVNFDIPTGENSQKYFLF
ncbi:hypothetical protein ABPG72_022424 [Tetrahymena utriculariae]